MFRPFGFTIQFFFSFFKLLSKFFSSVSRRNTDSVKTLKINFLKKKSGYSNIDVVIKTWLKF